MNTRLIPSAYGSSPYSSKLISRPYGVTVKVIEVRTEAAPLRRPRREQLCAVFDFAARALNTFENGTAVQLRMILEAACLHYTLTSGKVAL